MYRILEVASGWVVQEQVTKRKHWFVHKKKWISFITAEGSSIAWMHETKEKAMAALITKVQGMLIVKPMPVDNRVVNVMRMLKENGVGPDGKPDMVKVETIVRDNFRKLLSAPE